MPEISRIVTLLKRAADRPAALATLVSVEGSSYRRPGARLLLLPDGTHTGSISGGCLEEDVLERARRVLATGTPELARYDTTAENDLVWGVGLGCQGVVQIFIEPIPAVRPDWIATLAANRLERRATRLAVEFTGAHPRGTRLATGTESAGPEKFLQTVPIPPAIVIFGAGDDALPLVRLAKETGWHVTVADARTAYANADRFPEADRTLVAPADKIAALLSVDGRTFAVIMTHRFADDLALLRGLLPSSLPYLGLLGPRPRAERLLAQLAQDGFTPTVAQREKLHSPVGLDLGGTTPETIALSILAEIQSRLEGRTPGFLRNRPGPIHE